MSALTTWRGVLLASAAAVAGLAMVSCLSPAGEGSGEMAQRLPPIPTGMDITVRRIDGLRADFMRGADVSMLAQIESAGGVYDQEDGKPRDALEILKDHGLNWVRLRIWNHPVFPEGTTSYHGTPAQPGPVGGGNNDLAIVRGLAARARALGLKVNLVFHYSDFWADPGKQDTPAEWKGLTAAELERAVYDFTWQVLTQMAQDGAAPEMVEIGNEINSGMLWPLGQIADKGQASGYDALNRLLNSGARAVRDVSPSIKIMIHIAHDGGLAGARQFYDRVDPVVDYDYIGLSYYPYWHGSLADFRTTMNTITATYGKPVVVAETAYAFTNGNGDDQGNSWSGNDPGTGGFEVSVQGQATALRDIMEAVSDVPGGMGLGVFYWEPDWIPVRGAGWITGQGSGWDNQAWWDFQGKPLASMWTYRLASESRDTTPPTIAAAPVLSLETTVGTAPVLPATVSALFRDGAFRPVPVKWGAIDPSQYADTRTISLRGALEGTALAVETYIRVNPVNHAANGGFETGSLAPWISTATSGGATVSVFRVESSSPSGNTHTGSHTGQYWYGSDYAFDVQQTITGLPSGTYTYSAWVMGDNGSSGVTPRSLAIYAENGTTRVTEGVTTTGWQQWTQYTVTATVGATGRLTIGFAGDMHAGDWGKLDDVAVNRM